MLEGDYVGDANEMCPNTPIKTLFTSVNAKFYIRNIV